MSTEQPIPQHHDHDTPPAAATAPGKGLLSPALPFHELANDASYVLMDEQGRVLCAQQRGAWGWAYLGDFTAYHADVLHFSISVRRIANQTILQPTSRNKPWNVFLSHGTSLFISEQNWPGYPMLEMHLTNQDPESSQFSLGFNLGTEHLAIGAEPGSWDYLRVVAPGHARRFTVHRYFMPKQSLAELLGQTWPDTQPLVVLEKNVYMGLSAPHAGQIWNSAALGRYQAREGVFDSDEFALVYKSQAALDAYHANGPIPYAVGCVTGVNASHRQSANLFMDLNGKLNILDPQTGEIMPPANWPFAPTKILI